jgi:predicted permease
METVLILVRQIAIMGFFMAIGWILSRMKLISEQGTKDLSNLLLRVVVPAVIIKSFIVERTMQNTIDFLVSFALALASILLAILVARLVFRKAHAVEHFGTAFANAGFFGIPIVSALFGDEGVFYISSFIMLIFLFQWTYGVFLYTRDKTVFSVKKMVLNPVLIGFAIAMILFFSQLPLPTILTDALGMITPLNTPVAMIVLGCYLAKDKLLAIFRDRSAYGVMILRLILIPLFTIAMLSLVPDQFNTVRMAVLMPAIAPVGVNVAVFAGLYGQDYSKAVKCVCLSTVLSIVSIPLIVLLAQWVW